MSTALAAWRLDAEQIELIKTAFARGATDAELSLFIQTCNRLQLDPFARQIFLVKRYDKSLRREVATTQVSIDGFRLIAERTGQYRGQEAPLWCGPDGKWVEVWLSDQPPTAARVGVHREGFVEPMRRIARWSGYAQYTNEGNLNAIWSKFGDNMLLKCAEALALRAAFPHELSGIYTDDELPVDAGAIDATPMRPDSAGAKTAPRSAPRSVPQLKNNEAPRTIADFMAMETKPRPETAITTTGEASPFNQATGEFLDSSGEVADDDMENLELPVPDSEPAKPEAKVELPQPVDNVHRLPLQKPTGNEPVWQVGPHKGKRYTDTPREYMRSLLSNSWAKSASRHQMAWARYAVALRTERARLEGRE